MFGSAPAAIFSFHKVAADQLPASTSPGWGSGGDGRERDYIECLYVGSSRIFMGIVKLE